MKNKLRRSLRSWLGIVDLPAPIEVKDWQPELDALTEKVEKAQEAVEKFLEIECTVCHKKVITYPYGGGYYREADGSVICSGPCLDKRQKELRESK